MIRCIIAEGIKLKRTFTNKNVWIAPITTIFLCGILTYGRLFQSGSYNWWYTMILPGMLTLVCTEVIQKDAKKINYRAILGLPFDPSILWIGKIGICVYLFFISCVVFLIGVTLGGFVFGSSISLIHSVEASILLFLTFLWQIPLCLFLSSSIGMYTTFFINFACNIVFTICAAKSSIWWGILYAIPSRLMCPVINVLPNGLQVPAGDPLLNKSVILPGVVITLLMFIILSVLTALWFRRQEAK